MKSKVDAVIRGVAIINAIAVASEAAGVDEWGIGGATRRVLRWDRRSALVGWDWVNAREESVVDCSSCRSWSIRV